MIIVRDSLLWGRVPHLLTWPGVEWMDLGHCEETAGPCPALEQVPSTFSLMATSDAAKETWSVPVQGPRGPEHVSSAPPFLQGRA